MSQNPDNSKPALRSLPRHVAMIMDGNGRWATSKGLPRMEGHRRGAETVRTMINTCREVGVEYLTLYCFSNENWNRPQDELEFLMELLKLYLIGERQQFQELDVRLHVLGRRTGLSEDVLAEIDRSIEHSKDNKSMHLNLAINYGGRQEIVDAVRAISAKVASGEIDNSQIDEQLISDHLYTAQMPDPDLLIRTSGEMRISNFLLWQISYSEIWITCKGWPEFGRDDLLAAFQDYANRQRRFGKISADE